MSVPQCCVRSLSLPASLALATPQGSREPRVRSSNSATAWLRGTRRHGARSVSDHASFLLALARGPLPRSVRFVRQQIVSANPVRPRSDRSQLFLVNTGPRRSRVHALLVCRTPGISCEASSLAPASSASSPCSAASRFYLPCAVAWLCLANASRHDDAGYVQHRARAYDKGEQHNGVVISQIS